LIYFRLVLACFMLAGGILLDVLAWMHLVAQKEPQLVLHLSTAAIYIEGFNAVQISWERIREERRDK
jgi:hypothetical protein